MAPPTATPPYLGAPAQMVGRQPSTTTDTFIAADVNGVLLIGQSASAPPTPGLPDKECRPVQLWARVQGTTTNVMVAADVNGNLLMVGA